MSWFPTSLGEANGGLETCSPAFAPFGWRSKGQGTSEGPRGVLQQLLDLGKQHLSGLLEVKHNMREAVPHKVLAHRTGGSHHGHHHCGRPCANPLCSFKAIELPWPLRFHMRLGRKYDVALMFVRIGALQPESIAFRDGSPVMLARISEMLFSENAESSSSGLEMPGSKLADNGFGQLGCAGASSRVDGSFNVKAGRQPPRQWKAFP